MLDKPGFAAVTVQPIVHAVEHALQILAVEFVHVPGKRRQAAVNGVIHLLVRFVLDLRECGSPRIGRVDRILPACLRVNGRFVEDQRDIAKVAVLHVRPRDRNAGHGRAAQREELLQLLFRQVVDGKQRALFLHRIFRGKLDNVRCFCIDTGNTLQYTVNRWSPRAGTYLRACRQPGPERGCSIFFYAPNFMSIKSITFRRFQHNHAHVVSIIANIHRRSNQNRIITALLPVKLYVDDFAIFYYRWNSLERRRFFRPKAMSYIALNPRLIEPNSANFRVFNFIPNRGKILSHCFYQFTLYAHSELIAIQRVYGFHL